MPSHSDFDEHDMDDSERLRMHDRRNGGRRKLIRLIPDLSAGTILQTLTFLAMMFTAWGQYTSDRTQMRSDIESNRRESAANQLQMNQAINEQKSDIRETKQLVQSMAIDVGKMQTQLQYVPPPVPASPRNPSR